MKFQPDIKKIFSQYEQDIQHAQERCAQHIITTLRHEASGYEWGGVEILVVMSKKIPCTVYLEIKGSIYDLETNPLKLHKRTLEWANELVCYVYKNQQKYFLDIFDQFILQRGH